MIFPLLVYLIRPPTPTPYNLAQKINLDKHDKLQFWSETIIHCLDPINKGHNTTIVNG